MSTKAQGRSGLGLEAQREALARFAASEGFDIAREFIEIETGTGSDALARRPQLVAALAEAKRRQPLRRPDGRSQCLPPVFRCCWPMVLA